MSVFSTSTALAIGLFASMGLLANLAAEERTIEIDGIKRISLYGSHDLRIVQGDVEYVRVSADSDMMDRLQAEIHGRTLVLGRRGGRSWFGGGKAEFEVQLQNIEAIRHRGSGRILLEDFQLKDDLRIVIYSSGDFLGNFIKGEEVELLSYSSGELGINEIQSEDVEIRTNSSGDIHVQSLTAEDVEIRSYSSGDAFVHQSSVADDLEINIHSSGDVDVEALIAKEANVTIWSSGDATVNVSEELEANIYSSGDVSYRGSPRLEVTTRSSGRARALD